MEIPCFPSSDLFWVQITQVILIGGGLFDVGGTNLNLYSRQTKIIKFRFCPKFFRLTKVQYDVSGSANKFCDYTLVTYTYSNYSTFDSLVFNV